MRKRQSLQGFTLIELVAATALAAILAVGLLTVMASIAKDRRRRETATPDESWRSILRKDLADAMTYSSSNDKTGFDLAGFIGLDPATLTSDLRPARVSYRVLQVNATPWLIRRQQYLDDPVSPRSIQAITAGVVSIKLAAADTPTTPLSKAPPATRKTRKSVPSSSPSADRSHVLPPRVRVAVRRASSVPDAVVEEVWVRG